MVQQNQIRKQQSDADPERLEEVRHLVEEAMDEMSRGNNEEAKFVLDGARELDKHSVEQVLEDRKKAGT